MCFNGKIDPRLENIYSKLKQISLAKMIFSALKWETEPERCESKTYKLSATNPLKVLKRLQSTTGLLDWPQEKWHRVLLD